MRSVVGFFGSTLFGFLDPFQVLGRQKLLVDPAFSQGLSHEVVNWAAGALDLVNRSIVRVSRFPRGLARSLALDTGIDVIPGHFPNFTSIFTRPAMLVARKSHITAATNSPMRLRALRS